MWKIINRNYAAKNISFQWETNIIDKISDG